ncbi:MAG: protease [Nitrosomonas sp.]|uniref:trypsin-like serine protease n=1 Tax=Nitrosomonas sp. TaxID=42353 RepID=UPI0032EFFB24
MRNHCRKLFALSLLSLLFNSSIAAAAETPLFHKEDVFNFSKRADGHLVQTLVDNQKLLRDAGITTNLQLAHFFAQIATETGGIQRLDENLNYKKDQLVKVFKKSITEQKASEIAGKPREIANWVYGDKLGNLGRHTNDGWNYRGSGFIQLTGRGNFRDRGHDAKLPFETDPELARKPFEGLVAATAYWAANNISDIAASNDIRKVRVLVNGPAAHGLDAAKIWFGRASQVFKIAGSSAREDAILVAAGSEEESTGAVIDALESLGFIGSSVRRESAEAQEKSVSDALRAYQKSRGLKETGEFDEATLYSITDPQEWRGDPLEQADSNIAPMVGDPEATVTYDITSKTIATAHITPSISVPLTSKVEQGTGVINKSTNLSAQELTRLTNSEATYAPYEVTQGRQNEKGHFIPYSIIGDDERVVVQNTTLFPARAIVQILFTAAESGNKYLCTGTLISADTVLTAGHCIHSGTVDGKWYTDFTIYPGRNSGAQPFGSCTGKKLYALNGWVNAGSSTEARQYDLGAIKLDCDVGQRTGWLMVRALGDDEMGLPTTVQGYPADKTPAGRQYMSTDKIRNIQNLNVFYQNDTYGGMSGSPVLATGKNEIFAIHTSGLHNGEPWGTNNGSTRITQERLQAIMQWIHN